MKKVLLPALLLTTGVALGNVIFPYWFIAANNTKIYFAIITAVTIVVEFLVLNWYLVDESSSTIALATVTMNIVSAVLMFLLSITLGMVILLASGPAIDADVFIKILYTQYPAILPVSLITIALNTVIEFFVARNFFKSITHKELFQALLLANSISLPISFGISVYWPTLISYFAR